VPSGQPVTSFTIACNRAYVSQSGEKKEEVSFIRCVVWGRRAEVCNEYLKKGSPVFVEGRLQSRSWEAQDGTKRSTIEVQAQNVQFLGRGRGGEGAPSDEAGDMDQAGFEGQHAASNSKSKGAASLADADLQPDDEIPF